jgi:tetratricopeptide (TPR) repeat protein
MPHTGKYLEYALRGVQLDVGSPDSATTSFKYLHSSNALFQAGFMDEALMHADKSLAFNPHNPFSGYLRIYIRYMKHRDLAKTKRELLEILKQDSNRLDMLQEIGKVSYFMRDYQEAGEYYKKFLKLRETYQLNVFLHENLTMAIVFRELGRPEDAENLAVEYKAFADESRTRYKHLHLAAYYVYRNDIEKALDHLNEFSNEDNFASLTLLLPEDPLMDKIKDHPEFLKLMKKIEDQFWSDHHQLKERMAEKKLL